jgi:hypothetical protein
MNLSRFTLPHRPLLRELTLVIVVKLALIAAIYFAFFAGHREHIVPATVAEHFDG